MFTLIQVTYRAGSKPDESKPYLVQAGPALPVVRPQGTFVFHPPPNTILEPYVPPSSGDEDGGTPTCDVPRVGHLHTAVFQPHDEVGGLFLGVTVQGTFQIRVLPCDLNIIWSLPAFIFKSAKLNAEYHYAIALSAVGAASNETITPAVTISYFPELQSTAWRVGPLTLSAKVTPADKVNKAHSFLPSFLRSFIPPRSFQLTDTVLRQ